MAVVRTYEVGATLAQPNLGYFGDGYREVLNFCCYKVAVLAVRTVQAEAWKKVGVLCSAKRR